MDDFNRKRHAVYKLTYHAVFVIKYRRKVMSEPIIKHMRQYAAHLIGQCYQGRLIELNGEPIISTSCLNFLQQQRHRL